MKKANKFKNGVHNACFDLTDKDRALQKLEELKRKRKVQDAPRDERIEVLFSFILFLGVCALVYLIHVMLEGEI